MAAPDTAPRPRLAAACATVLGIGYLRPASGTWGSLPGLALGWAAWTLGGTAAVAGAAVVVTALGIWSADRWSRAIGRGDPGEIVIDETAGQLVALVALAPSPARWLVAFLAFRAFDIIKPYPVNRLERLPGGVGIVADDVAAGILANVVMQMLVFWTPL